MNELIEVKQATIGNENISAVSARDLYLGLGFAAAAWSRWAKTNIEQNEFFVENVDWVGFAIEVNGSETSEDSTLNTVLSETKKGNFARDYAVSIEMAKHLSMMAKTAKAHDYRNYFIECEKKANTPMTTLEFMLYSVNAMIEQDKKVKALEESVSQLDAKIEEVKAKATMSPMDYYSIAGYAGLRGLTVDVHQAGRFGKSATKFSKDNSYEIFKAHSEIFGAVNTYHLDVLTKLFGK